MDGQKLKLMVQILLNRKPCGRGCFVMVRSLWIYFSDIQRASVVIAARA